MLKINFYILFCMLMAPVFSFSQVALPFTEKFGDSPTQSQWNYSSSGTIVGAHPVVGSPNGGQGSLMYNFYNSQGASTYNVVSPILNSSGNSWIRVTFDFAGANRYTMPIALQTVFADDHIILEYSTDEGNTYTEAHNYEIGVNGELNTGGILNTFFMPTAAQWVTKSIILPAGTNRVKFKGLKNIIYQAGNFAFLDNVVFEECSTAAPVGNTAQQFCSGNTLAQLAVSGTDIRWYDSATGGNLLPDTTPLVNGGMYYASQTQNLCESMERLVVMTSSGACLGVNEADILHSETGFYPNPVGDVLHFKSKKQITKIIIYDMAGKRSMEVKDKEITSVNVGFLVKGVYMVEAYFSDGGRTTEKIVKK